MKRLYLWLVLIIAAPTNAQLELPSIEKLLINIVATTIEGRVTELNKALLTLPEHTDMFVRTAIEAGYPDPDVIAQCKLGMSEHHVVSLIDVMVENGSDLEPIVNNCLPRVPAEQMVNVVTSLLVRADPLQMEEMIQLTLAVLHDEGIDSSTVLVNSLVEGGLIDVDDSNCTGECLRPLAEDLVSNIGDQFDVAPDTDIVDEPAFSES